MAPDAARRSGGLEQPAFEILASEMWERIPAELKEGVDALVVEAGERGHPSLGGVYTLGECVTESWPSGYGDSGDVRSQLVLYHGSFLALAEEDASFQWEEETWETILHELLHHREVAAGESGLDDLDWAIDQNFRRHAGRSFDPAFYRAVPADPDGGARLDSDVFVEGRGELGSARFTWRGRHWTVRVPDSDKTLFVQVRNLAGGRLCVVVDPRISVFRRLLGRRAVGIERLMRHALPALQAGG